MKKFNWENSTKIRDGYVLIDGKQYQIVEAEYQGNTPLSAENLNAMQDVLIENMKKSIIYASEETEIGEWEGEKLYQIILKGTTNTNGNDLTIDLSNYNVSKIKIFDGNINGEMPINFVIMFGSDISQLYYCSTRLNDSKLYLRCSDAYSSKPFEVVIQYTKRGVL